MRVTMVTGSYPPVCCGVGDNTARLVEDLQRLGMEITVLTGEDWTSSAVGRLVRAIDSTQPDIIHIQYPTTGYGYNLGPHLASILRSAVVTLHEVSQVHPLRQLSLYLFSVRARHIIFTSTYERDYAIARAPWITSKVSVIPIGSAIEVKANKESKEKLPEVLYFGLIRPKKGIERVIRLAELVRERGAPWKIHIVGAVDNDSASYCQDLQSQSKGLPVTWSIGLDEEAVGEIIADSSIAYLPFPDGASERRSSLLAVLGGSVAIVSTVGPHTPDSFQRFLSFSANPEEAYEKVADLLARPDERNRLAEAGLSYASSLSMASLAERHAYLYEQLAGEIRL